MTISDSSLSPLEPPSAEAVDYTEAFNQERMRQLARRQKRMLYVSMSATLLLGLTTTASYIRGRMVEAAPIAPTVARPRVAEVANPVISAPQAVAVEAKRSPLAPTEPPKAKPLPTASTPVTAAPAPAKPASVTPSVEAPAVQRPNPVATPATLSLIDPRPGELYLQLAALGPNSTAYYLGYLEQKQIHARIAPGPSAGLYRLVLGPFPDDAEMLRTKARLDHDAIECMIRKY